MRFILAPLEISYPISFHVGRYKINVAEIYMFLLFVEYYNISTQGQDKMPMGTNIKMSLMPKGINKIIYNPGVSISTPEYVLIPYP